MKLTFLGAAGEVTGSCYLIETGHTRFLVDCGMFQGGHEADEKNVSALDFDVTTLDFVLITHAHIDHCGLLPRLTALGYKGPIYATTPTADLLEVMLKDSAHIQQKEAEWAAQGRQHGKWSNHDPLPLYTIVQAEKCLEQVSAIAYNIEFKPHSTVRCRFRDAGHILGSAIIETWITENSNTKKIVFSGDLGQPARPLMNDPTPIEETDILLMESTYGNRLHKRMQETYDELVQAIHHTLHTKKGNVIIPAFALGRTQEILFILVDLVKQGRLKDLRVYVDSPMAMRATAITLKHLALLDDETRQLIQQQKADHYPIQIDFAETTEESIALNHIQSGAVILAASGMCDAGRIKHHLKYNISRPECSIIIVGFQAAGTLGRRLVDGAERIRIFGEEKAVNADIYTIGGLSAHADQQALLQWLRHFKRPPEHTFIVHGERETANGFAELVKQQFGWPVEVPARYSTTLF